MESKYRTGSQLRGTRLIRGADGRLRSASQGSDIGDIWAEQRRIRLAEAILEDKKKVEKLKKKQNRSLFGRRKTGEQPASRVADDVVVTISVPKIKLPGQVWARVAGFIKTLTRRQQVVGMACVAIIVVGTLAICILAGSRDGSGQTKPGTAAVTSVLSAEDQQPAYRTLLPADKDIQDVGGWQRVSPPDKDPVFAYADTIDGISVSVSQQPLPAAFEGDTEQQLAKLAESFTANEKVTAGDSLLYIGTSSKGPQSVITSKEHLLILIKSQSKLSSQQWADYVAQLH